MTRPSTKGAYKSDSLSTFALRPWVSAMIIEKIMVVAPTTAVPISTGLAVALNVLPAPSFDSSMSFARSKFTSTLKSFLISCRTFGTCSISESS